jgi:hypothetical protein
MSYTSWGRSKFNNEHMCNCMTARQYESRHNWWKRPWNIAWILWQPTLWRARDYIHSAVQKLYDWFLKNRRHMRKSHNVYFKISSTGIYTGFRAVIQFMKAAENSFGPSLMYQLRLLGSQNIRKVEFIFNLRNTKYSGGDTFGEYGE